jgi:hypothetical protein
MDVSVGDTLRGVRFTPKSGHSAGPKKCPLSAKSGHSDQPGTLHIQAKSAYYDRVLSGEATAVGQHILLGPDGPSCCPGFVYASGPNVLA